MGLTAISIQKQKISISPSEQQQAKMLRSCTRSDQERPIPACTACHGPNGAGNGPAKYPSKGTTCRPTLNSNFEPTEKDLESTL